jgi:hypothetical protein
MTIEQNIERIANALEQLVPLFIPSKGTGWSTPGTTLSEKLDSQQQESAKCEEQVAAAAPKRTRAKKTEAASTQDDPRQPGQPEAPNEDAPADQPETSVTQEPEDKEAVDALRREVVGLYQAVSKRFPEFKKDYEKFRDGKTINSMTFAEMKAALDFILNYGGESQASTLQI